MAANSRISWTDHTFNPWIGCTKVGPGCDHCYAEQRMDTRYHRVKWGAGQERSLTKTWGQPANWNKRHEAFFAQHRRRQRVFCASLADVFDNEVDPQWRADLFGLIAKTSNLDWLLLTKRIGNARTMMSEALQARGLGHLTGLSNVWLGATVVNQAEADRDIPKLLAAPALVRFLSIEPMLGPIDLRRVPLLVGAGQVGRLGFPAIHWVICGGESGGQARPMHPDWARSLRDQCSAAGVPFHFKQWGEWIDADQPGADLMGTAKSRIHEWDDGEHSSVQVGKEVAGHLLDGIEHNGFPT